MVGLCCIGDDTDVLVFAVKLESFTLDAFESELIIMSLEGGSILKIGNGDFGMIIDFNTFNSALTLVNVGFAVVTAIVGNGNGNVVVTGAGVDTDTIGIDFCC